MVKHGAHEGLLLSPPDPQDGAANYGSVGLVGLPALFEVLQERICRVEQPVVSGVLHEVPTSDGNEILGAVCMPDDDRATGLRFRIIGLTRAQPDENLNLLFDDFAPLVLLGRL